MLFPSSKNISLPIKLASPYEVMFLVLFEYHSHLAFYWIISVAWRCDREYKPFVKCVKRTFRYWDKFERCVFSGQMNNNMTLSIMRNMISVSGTADQRRHQTQNHLEQRNSQMILFNQQVEPLYWIIHENKQCPK